MRTWQREHPWLSRMLMLMKAIKMTDMTGPGTTGDYKAQAKRLRSAMASQGTPISHSRALDLIAEADHVIDLGPGPGEKGGRLLAAGTPEKLSHTKASITGRFLAPLLAKND